jgi:hypothetical protein
MQDVVRQDEALGEPPDEDRRRSRVQFVMDGKLLDDLTLRYLDVPLGVHVCLTPAPPRLRDAGKPLDECPAWSPKRSQPQSSAE